jgi:hypothetical protein
MQIQADCEASKLRQLQILVKKFDLRWVFNPYPKDSRKPHNKWRVGIDYNNISMDKAREFDLAWKQMETPIKETVKKYSVRHKIKVWFLALFQ